MERYRNEWKYLCQEPDLARIERRVAAVMQPDSHALGDGGRYGVHSLYLEDAWDSSAYETDAGLYSRFKYRIRYYGNSPETLHLERKEKRGGLGRKATCPLSRAQCEAILAGDVSGVLRDARNPVLVRFCADSLSRGFKPRIIIDYERTAFVEPNGDIRITIDRALSASRRVGAFLSGDYQRYPLLPGSHGVLEVKFDDVLPGYVKRAVSFPRMRQTSFSKYMLGCETVRRVCL